MEDVKEFARYGMSQHAGGIELLHARYSNHRFGAHSHEFWAIGAVLAGAKDLSARRDGSHILRAGDVYVIPPLAVHAGQCAYSTACEYTILYCPDAEWRAHCADCNISLDDFSMRGLRLPDLAREISEFADGTLTSTLLNQTAVAAWDRLLENLLRSSRASPAASAQDREGHAPPRIVAVRDFLVANWARHVSLSELAAVASLSTYELTRRFTAAYGLPPHRYQVLLRVQQAKALLLQGATISEAAMQTGFADQSHLGRHFKSLLGITPGAVARTARPARSF